MFKILLPLLLLTVFVTGCDDGRDSGYYPPVAVGPTDPAEILGIEEEIVYFDMMIDTGCYPYLVEDYNAYYCSIDDVIYFGNGLTDVTTLATQYWLLAHEDGHSDDPDINNVNEPVLDLEQYADCFGAQKMRELRDKGYFTDSDIQSIVDFIYTLPYDDVDHGTPDQRYKAFVFGYDNGDCSVY